MKSALAIIGMQQGLFNEVPGPAGADAVIGPISVLAARATPRAAHRGCAHHPRQAACRRGADPAHRDATLATIRSFDPTLRVMPPVEIAFAG